MAAASPHLDDAVDKVINGIANTAPQIRTTGGSTQQILMRVTQDFKDFHKDDAEKAILCFVDEYIQVQYAGQNGFKLSNVSKQLQLPDMPKTITKISVEKARCVSCGMKGCSNNLPYYIYGNQKGAAKLAVSV